MLLSFDDGYASFYTRVYPLLKAFGYPAVLALVGSWLDAPEDATVMYGDQPVPRRNFMSWEQLREVAASGLVEIASHSYALHQGIIANPQGNLEPALTSRLYDPARAITKTIWPSSAAFGRPWPQQRPAGESVGRTPQGYGLALRALQPACARYRQGARHAGDPDPGKRTQPTR